MKTEKITNQNKLTQDTNNSSRSLQSGLGNQQKQSSQSSIPTSKANSTSNISSGPGRGWHGDAKGHARAGSQSHKRTGKRHS
ncbi:hypothetical protein ABID22_001845 [Pontibacter aydingkolensis]|uniref:Uncharacterized protein n=1 Tax=Pontibacter aydingkolensis TaxID=1911536 RepID=A0ABS7CPK1_9BACT|nr:hypothetical protein [Pontibacter aydingkolensis]MBW7465771.1 hypothetical protein [Pontibacter aydingkolensis]